MAITTNFLKTNGLANKGVNKAKDLQQAEQEGRAKLEGKFPKQVSNQSEVHYQVEYVNINGQNYAVIGYPTYRQNGQGTFDFVSMTCEVVAVNEGEGICIQKEGDKSQIEWYAQDSGKPKIPGSREQSNNFYGTGSLNNSGFVNGPTNNKPRLT